MLAQKRLLPNRLTFRDFLCPELNKFHVQWLKTAVGAAKASEGVVGFLSELSVNVGKKSGELGGAPAHEA